MAKYKAYPEYKDSGVEWLGDIPTHWDCTALKRLCSLITGLTPPTQNEDNYADEGYPWVRPEDLNESGFGTHASKYVSDIGWKLLRHIKPNSTLICCIGTIGKCGYVKETVSTNQQITAATFRDCERFNYYLLQSARAQLEELATGNVLKILNSERLGALNVVKVNRKEANTIAEFLDHETTKIDDLIEKQQQLIELLKEKRQAVISHAVTKGLNPDVPMKDSGVEWLGEVPAHWKVSKLKYFASIQGGFAFSSDSFTHEGVQILRIGNLYQNNLELERQPIFLDVNELDRFRDFVICKDDILMSLTGTLGKRDYGFAIKVDRDDVFLLNQRVAKITPDETRLCRDFLLYILWSDSYLNQLYSLPSGTKQANLSNSNVTDILVACPAEISEQKSIIEMVTKQMEVFDSLMDNSLSLMESLQERRTALISAAVTGKIDVRDWVAPDAQDIEASQEAIA